MKSSRRRFLQTTAAAGSGLFFCPCGLGAQAPASASGGAARRQIVIGGQRVRTIDMHAHVFIDEAWPLVKDFPQTDKAMANLGRSPMAIDQASMDRRFREMDGMGIDVHVISVHPSQFCTARARSRRAHREDAEREDRRSWSRRIRTGSSDSATCRSSSPTSRSNSSSTRSGKLDLRGFIIGANVNGGELTNPKLDPFWKKAEELRHGHYDSSAGVRRCGQAAGGGGSARQQHRVSARYDDRARAPDLRRACSTGLPGVKIIARARRRLSRRATSGGSTTATRFRRRVRR